MTTSIVIPNFNGRELLEKNLPFVIEASHIKKNNIKEIIVVDDASTDDSVEYLKRNYPRSVKVIVHKVNRGFADSVNTGARSTKSDLICLINSDVSVSKNFLSTMDERFKNENIFAVSLHEKGYGYAKGKFVEGFIVYEGVPQTNKIQDTFWASGGSAVFKRSIWMDLKGMDSELMPFYWEDIDLSYRAQKRGYKILWDSQANVTHNHESTYKKLNQKYVQRMRERNQLLFIWKNLTSGKMFRKHIQFLIKKIIKHPGYLVIFLMATSKLKIVLEKRKVESKETTVSDEAIFAKFN